MVRTQELILAPNVLSLCRIPLAVFFALAVTLGRPYLGVAVLLVAGATDVADGWCARHFCQQTGTGRIVDPLADKVFFGTAALALVVLQRLSVGAAVLLGTREIIQSLLAVWLALKGKLFTSGERTPSSAAGKLTTALQSAALAASLTWADAFAPLVFATAICGAMAAAEYCISAARGA